MKKIISVLLAALMLAAVAASNGVFVASTLPGDVNGDGEVNNKDVVVLFRHISSGVLCEDETVYDYNKDGNVDNKDVVSLFRSVSGSGAVSVYDGYVSKLVGGYYERADDDDIYNGALAKFDSLRKAADAETDPNRRFVLYAKAEAELLDSAVMVPTTTQGGAYTISRVAPRTVPYVQWGNDNNRLKGMVIFDEFLTPAERNELLDQWAKARSGEGTYDPAAYLTSKGHTIKDEYALTFSTAPVTLDWLNTSSQADTEITVNTVDGLVEYDNFGFMQPALAESWDVSKDGLTYTFHIRKNVAWYTSGGAKYADVTAHDFEAGFRHMLDCQAGLESLVFGIVKGAQEYVIDGGSWKNVGAKATDDYTFVITLERPTSYFLTMLTYSIFLPICDSFYQSKGGVYGIEAFREASEDMYKYTYGMNTDITSQVYCGAFLLKKLDSSSEIVIEKNPNYYKAADVKLNKVRWILFDNNNTPYSQLYKDVCDGVYAGVTLSAATGILEMATKDGNKDKYAYISDTNSVTYFSGLNLNRGTFELTNGTMTSPKTEQEKADTVTALNNKHFRQALAYAFDRTTFNAISKGEELADANLRNMYTSPNFVYLSKDIKADGHTFKAGTSYGDMVQYYLEKLGSPIKVEDGQDGWYDPDGAKESLKAAKKELGDNVNWPVIIDIIYLSYSDSSWLQAECFKKSLEDVLGSENVVVNMIGGERNDYYASGYRAADGKAANYDIFYGSGWGADYGDPSTFLDTFAPHGELVHLFGVY